VVGVGTPPARVHAELKIVWRITGSGSFRIEAIGSEGRIVGPVWGPEAHGGSTWHRPGEEWGTGWRFPTPGCWQLHAWRDDVSGDIWLRVAEPGR